MPSSVDTNFRFSHDLLDHDGLMTPVLHHHFGILTVRQTHAQHYADRFVRNSSIYQVASGEKILDAVLDISLPAVPSSFLNLLQTKGVLFGQLLIDFSIDVQIVNRSLYQTKADHSPRWGRCLTIQHRDSQDVICTVDELLVSEPSLLRIAL